VQFRDLKIPPRKWQQIHLLFTLPINI